VNAEQRNRRRARGSGGGGADARAVAVWQHKGIIVNSAVKARTFNAIVLQSVARAYEQLMSADSSVLFFSRPRSEGWPMVLVSRPRCPWLATPWTYFLHLVS